MAETKETIKEQFDKLPQDIKDAILAADLPEKFKIIANKHKLRIDQSGTLENETMFVMLGLLHPDDYTNNLKKEAGMSDEEAEKIAEEVSRTIFLPIRTSLQKLHEEEKEEGGAIEHPPIDQTHGKPPEPVSGSAESETGVVTDKRKDIFREKLEKQTRSAKEEVLLREPFDNTQNKPQTSASQQTKPDPYREPIEKKDTEGIKQEGLSLTKNEQLTTDNENTSQIKGPKITTTPPQTQMGVKKPDSTPIPTMAEKLKTETPPRIIPPSSALSTSTPSTSITPPTKAKKEVPLPKTGIINMPNKETPHEKKAEVPQKPSVEINKTPAFTKEKISYDKSPVSSKHEGDIKDVITQKSENTDNIPQDTLNILDKPKAPKVLTKEKSVEKTTIKYPQAALASSPPGNLPQKEIGEGGETPEPGADLKKKDSVSDPYREPID